jgi:hypothetical protein
VFSVYLSSLSYLENTEGNFLVMLALGFSHGKSQVIHELLILNSYVSHMTFDTIREMGLKEIFHAITFSHNKFDAVKKLRSLKEQLALHLNFKI